MRPKDSMITNNDEIPRLLNQIASDMVKRSDVNDMIAAAVKEAVEKANEENECKMKSMAAEYEAVIASLKKEGQRRQKGSKWPCSSSTQLTVSCHTYGENNHNPY